MFCPCLLFACRSSVGSSLLLLSLLLLLLLVLLLLALLSAGRACLGAVLSFVLVVGWWLCGCHQWLASMQSTQ
jgi:hypothetical protein